MKFVKAVIVEWRGSKPDALTLHTDFPPPFSDPAHGETLQLDFTTPAKEGEAYIRTHFPGVPYEVIQAWDGKIRGEKNQQP